MKKISLLFALITCQLMAFAQIHTQSPLPYAYDALEPFFDKQTMEIHFDKHHKTYISNLNNAVKGTPYEFTPVQLLVNEISKYPMVVRNNAGGHWNHTFFWQILTSHDKTGAPSEALLKAINETFGTLEDFKLKFVDASTKRFGSGWAWLIVKDGKLVITTTPNQDNPLMDIAEEKGSPILALDVWEHAYYLKYQNKRADFAKAFFEIINWEEVSKKYELALKK